ncbi:MAG TPA: extracellular solute-binding protein [Stellaceae bacterium]|nr:extracellular solute-binding protein [Stellaceae bacterium]
MRRLRAAFLSLFAAFLASSSVAAAAPWDDVVKAALAEGEVDVHGAPGRLYEQLLTERFRAAYPGIKLNFSGSSGRDAIPQIMREREAGVYHWDVYVGGTPSILQALKPAGAFAPLRPALVRPELVADATWRDGFDAGWMDQEKKFTYSFDLTIDPVVLVNWDFVAPADLKTYADLLKPQFADKIVWDDPRLPGAGPLVGQTIVANFGTETLIRFLAEQKITYTTNRRQNAEWVVRGRYPVGFGTGFDDLEIFQQQGLGRNVKAFPGDQTKFLGGPGFGTVSLMDKAPHPNAARVYIDWLLSKEGQTEWNKSRRDSRRLDVQPGAPEFLPQPGVSYVNSQSEAQIPSRELVSSLARKYLGEQKQP